MRLASALLIASCGVHASIAPLMGQGITPEPVVVAQRPTILPNRWQENWSALADPRIKRERFDNLKYIPLSNDDPGTYLSLGLNARGRFETNRGEFFGIAAIVRGRVAAQPTGSARRPSAREAHPGLHANSKCICAGQGRARAD